ncbi:MAG: tRNA (N(6)-L-threonylcarbamoyladenosine(37)-C(2))-methylthiotransferase MtaB [Chlamydiae bacterium GWC2_50_10]|nr:MAG: tRNA (N(6)-L-threonylcarbamoyladenosine(37)-C(2))-methylthiotransferase MtaB [Chlamydiae bacterium GWA2_50_15]OGN54937.1 MAG: tRNA (N(6)-L-threonylcarbamoyladenosine(37)-C(2))-methylthiotransferase MtaB [Chlamydiae bacterium GWC2_50_10]OGN68538.1 MAG: tRNA (N(6)-L-threonylcarbamoyladenosine(37)-C(2))-methylthiotransferase MtaB [Chlamydiae bacterium RIFCSPLOWO2_02_FULL_49_12]
MVTEKWRFWQNALSYTKRAVVKKKFKVAALGCRTNQYEAEAFRTQLERAGAQSAQKGEAADVCIVNTCGVTASAARDSIARARKLAQENPRAALFVTGCHAKEVGEAVSERRILVIPNEKKEELLSELFPKKELAGFAIDSFAEHTRAFLKVQDGCNSFCSYCIIPYVRGRSRSRSLDSILIELRGLLARGYREVVLTGINIGDFDGGEQESLASLLRAADGLEGLERIRLSSIDPEDVSEELCSALLFCKKSCPSLHLVLQSGSNVTLKRMHRSYTRQRFLEVVSRLKKGCSDFTFTTDVIVGFPGETERDFEESLEVVREVEFAKVHVFPYSPRERTRAALFPDRLPQAVVFARKKRLLQEAQERAFSLRERFVGREMEVLLEGKARGRTANFLPVRVEGRHLKPNQMVPVKLIANDPMSLVGRVA